MIKAHLNNDMSIIKISGDDTREYLNNIITNNIEQVNETKSIYSCLLTPQGKFIADFYVASFDNDSYEVCPNATVPIEIKLIPEFDDTTISYEINWTYNSDFFANEDSLTLDVIDAGNYEFTLTNSETGCSYSDSINITELEACVIPQGISPNGDGYNDNFDLSSYNVSSLKVFNRLGTLVYSKNNYLNEWKGQSDNGNLLPVGTYFYVMSYEEDKIKTDWVYLNY